MQNRSIDRGFSVRRRPIQSTSLRASIGRHLFSIFLIQILHQLQKKKEKEAQIHDDNEDDCDYMIRRSGWTTSNISAEDSRVPPYRKQMGFRFHGGSCK